MNKKGHEGIEPSSSGWKPEIIASIRMPHGGESEIQTHE